MAAPGPGLPEVGSLAHWSWLEAKAHAGRRCTRPVWCCESGGTGHACGNVADGPEAAAWALSHPLEEWTP